MRIIPFRKKYDKHYYDAHAPPNEIESKIFPSNFGGFL